MINLLVPVDFGITQKIKKPSIKGFGPGVSGVCGLKEIRNVLEMYQYFR
jgi:hypothetical protein